jgi:hypothetical protein
MRRFRLALVLPLLLLFAQHGAMLHELSHLSYVAVHTQDGPQLQQDESLLNNGLCLACYSFAQVTSPTAGAVTAFCLPKAPTLKISAPPCLIGAADIPTPRSRGPPHFPA